MRGIATDQVTRQRVRALAAAEMGNREIARSLGLPESTVRHILAGAQTCANRNNGTIRVACDRGHFLAEVGASDCVMLKLRCRRCEQDVIVRVEKGKISYPALT